MENNKKKIKPRCPQCNKGIFNCYCGSFNPKTGQIKEEVKRRFEKERSTYKELQ